MQILAKLFKTKQQLAYESIKTAIIQGEYKPGEKLVVSTISKKLGISNIPVREALKKLESEGFAKNTPHLGSVVAEFDVKNYSGIFVIRKLLESQATFSAAENMPRDVLKGLKKNLEEMKGTTDPVKAAELNHQFHDLIFASCGNATLYKMIQQLWPLSPRSRFVFSFFPTTISISAKEHEEIYLSIQAKDPEGAKQAFLKHMQRGYGLLMNVSALFPGANLG